MKNYVTLPIGFLVALGVLACPGEIRADSAAAAAEVVEHHIYLHVVPTEEVDGVRVIVADQKYLPEPPKPDDAKESPPPPVAEETEIDLLQDEVTLVDKPEKAEPVEDHEPEAIEKSVAEDVVEPDLDPEVKEALPDEETIDETGVLPLPVVPDQPAHSLVLEEEKKADTPMGLLLFIFVLAIFLGFELISKVPSQLHTPLMSGSNAISGITIVGALAAAGLGVGGGFGILLGTLAVAFATINVVGGYMVTNRMLAMFKTKDGGSQ